MPRKSKIEELGIGTEIQFLKHDGKSFREIAEVVTARHGMTITKNNISRYLAKLERSNTDVIQTKEYIRLEINRENAISELSAQLNEYTDNYNNAMTRGDERAAAVWSRNRIDLLKEMLRVTGLYDKARKEAEKEPVKNDMDKWYGLLAFLQEKFKDCPEIRMDIARFVQEYEKQL